MYIRLVNVHFLNVPSVSSPYFNKIKRKSHLGKWHGLSLEILLHNYTLFETGRENVNEKKKILINISHAWIQTTVRQAARRKTRLYSLVYT